MIGHLQINALELLMSDHRVISRLFKRIKSADASRHGAIFALINDALDIHIHIEESVLYPAVAADGSERLAGLIREGIEEHRQIKMLLKEMAELIGDTDNFAPKLRVLIEDFEIHAAEEERDVFRMIAEQFDAAELYKLGRAMKEERDFKKIQAAAFRQRKDRPVIGEQNTLTPRPTHAKPPFHIDRF